MTHDNSPSSQYPLQRLLLELLHAARDSRDASARAELNRHLRESVDARKAMARLMVDEQVLLSCLRDESIVALLDPDATSDKQPPPVSGWLAWPTRTAAAGVLIGMLFTSVVFALVRPGFVKVVSLMEEGFENVAVPEATGLPRAAGKWSGDFTEIVARQQDVDAASGRKMLRFVRADYEGKTNALPSRTSSIWRLVDLRPYRQEYADGGAVVQLSAVLNAQAFSHEHSYYGFVQIHALDATTAEEAYQHHWAELNSSALALTRGTSIAVDHDAATWQRIDCEQRLPGKTDFLLIEIGLKQLPKTDLPAELGGHYLDNVRLMLGRRPLLP